MGGGECYSVACSAADYDGDGHIDILVLGYDSRILYHNNGNGTFTEVTQKAGLATDSRWGVSGVWFDYNGDGLLDLYVAALPPVRQGQVQKRLSRCRLSGTS